MNIGAYTKPIFDKITAEDKWYANIPTGKNEFGETTYMQRNHAWNIIKSYNNGTLKIKHVAQNLNALWLRNSGDNMDKEKMTACVSNLNKLLIATILIILIAAAIFAWSVYQSTKRAERGRKRWRNFLDED